MSEVDEPVELRGGALDDELDVLAPRLVDGRRVPEAERVAAADAADDENVRERDDDDDDDSGCPHRERVVAAASTSGNGNARASITRGRTLSPGGRRLLAQHLDDGFDLVVAQ